MSILEKPVFVDVKLREVKESGRLDYRSRSLPTWCPGCGYFSIVEGVTSACNEMGINRDNAVVVSGIGCSSRFPFFVNLFGFHTLHGRVLPVATGIKTANNKLTVIAVGGDGDGFAIGGGHVPHAAKRNVDITYLLFDNGIYGLTKGQTSPTSAVGLRTSTTPFENPERPLNPLMMVLTYGASWVGQSYAGRPDHLREMITQAVAHRGFSYLHILSPCVTFDKTSKTYVNLGQAVRELPPDHDSSNLMAALEQAQDTETPAIGLFYQQFRPTLADTFDKVIAKATGDKG
ncbi:MAG: 2-oxoacid:ferredoxin oxidoreductase subunit beta [Magnetococcales bacterium]|nr:2-oxoacid:ferredoxin oxidoreductase subunit beta [Magnetococcales bacterium]NGZ26062.1 2-oxoacid:ferredoxin oxidoreductase subunit beta [Magnetococcales bacterium]